jgi:hypothetical protein
MRQEPGRWIHRKTEGQNEIKRQRDEVTERRTKAEREMEIQTDRNLLL